MATRQTAHTRARDVDRNNTCQVLDSALADGQLSGEEHRTRVGLATTAATLGDLQSLVDDLQNDNAPVQMPNLQKPSRLRAAGTNTGAGWGLRLATAAVLVVLGIAIGWGLYGNTSSPLSFQTDPGAKSDGIEGKVLTPPRQLQSLGGLEGLFEQMRQRFGDTMGYSVVVYPEYAVVARADPNDDRRTLRYTYRGGFDDPSTSATGTDDVLVDLAAFDVVKAIEILRGTPKAVGIEAADVKTENTYLTVDPAREPQTPGEIILRANVSSEFGNGSITFGAKGEIKSIDYADD